MTTPRIEEILEEINVICKQADQYQRNAGYPVAIPAREIVKAKLYQAHQAGIDELIHSWNKAEQRLDGTTQGALNCIEQFRNTITALQDNK